MMVFQAVKTGSIPVRSAATNASQGLHHAKVDTQVRFLVPQLTRDRLVVGREKRLRTSCRRDTVPIV